MKNTNSMYAFLPTKNIIKLALILSLFSLSLGGCFWGDDQERGSITRGWSPKTFFEQAQDAGSVEQKIKLHKQLQAAYPGSKYALQSKLEVAYALYKEESYNEAISNLNDYIKLYPEHFSTPYAYYLRGVISEDKSRSILDDFVTDSAQRDVKSVRDAFNYYLALIEKFPEAQYSEEAKNRLIILRNTLARHELFVAIFYTQKDANIAAINRTKFIIERYPNTPSIPAALHLMAHNYDIIGIGKLAADARRVLKNSYPLYEPHYSLE